MPDPASMPTPASAPPTSVATRAQDTPAEVLAHVQQHWDGIQPNSPVYGFFFSSIELISATRQEGRVVAHLLLGPQHINSKGILHGSVSATLVDWAGGMSIAAATGTNRTGVSVDIHVSYVAAARVGDTLEIESWVSRAGRSLAYTGVEIRKVGGGKDGNKAVVATGSHTKYLHV